MASTRYMKLFQSLSLSAPTAGYSKGNVISRGPASTTVLIEQCFWRVWRKV